LRIINTNYWQIIPSTNLDSSVRMISFFFKSLSEGGVQLGPLGTAATDCSIVACPGWLWCWRIWWNEDWQGKPKYSEKIRPSAALSTTNPTWPDPGSNAGRRGGKPATNRLSYGAGRRMARFRISAESGILCSLPFQGGPRAHRTSYHSMGTLQTYTLSSCDAGHKDKFSFLKYCHGNMRFHCNRCAAMDDI
jgi:hypothetical protein